MQNKKLTTNKKKKFFFKFLLKDLPTEHNPYLFDIYHLWLAHLCTIQCRLCHITMIKTAPNIRPRQVTPAHTSLRLWELPLVVEGTKLSVGQCPCVSTTQNSRPRSSVHTWPLQHKYAVLCRLYSEHGAQITAVMTSRPNTIRIIAFILI